MAGGIAKANSVVENVADFSEMAGAFVCGYDHPVVSLLLGVSDWGGDGLLDEVGDSNRYE